MSDTTKTVMIELPVGLSLVDIRPDGACWVRCHDDVFDERLTPEQASERFLVPMLAQVKASRRD